jgi:diguanylate cyclase (GGDEF)-like protein
MAQVRSVDRVARFGGEEFAVLLVETDRVQAGDTAQRIRAVVERDPILAAQGVALNVTISIGAAVLPDDARSGSTLVAAADKALYGAKAAGRNRVVAYPELG